MREPDAGRRPEHRPARAFIIGAAKAGTTTLFDALAAHPEIYASAVKETGFFSHDERFGRGLNWYESTFFAGAPGTSLRLEASPAYLTWSEKVAPRLYESYGRHPISLVAILRDPVERAYSHYCHRVRLGHETLSFAEALAQEEERLRAHWADLQQTGNGKYGYFRAGCYATRLKPFLSCFDRRQICVLLHEDLRRERFAATMRKLADVLQVDPSVALRPGRLNAPSRERFPGVTRAYWALKRTRLKPLYRGFVPRSARRAILDALFAPSAKPSLDSDLERQLRLRYADEIRECQDLIDRDLSQWLPA